MAEENTPTAAPAENAGTEAPNTNQTEQTPAPQTENATQQPQAPVLTEEQQAALKFIESNGGLEKIKQTISARTTQQTLQSQEQPKSAENTQPTEPHRQATEQTQQTPAGYQTMQEFMVEQYYNNLANKPEYAPIANQIRSGEIFKEMAKFNIRPIDNGMINQKQVNDFLDLYVKTVPAPAPTNPMTATPTVEYVNVGKEITSRSDAMKVMEQKGHPMHEQALKFMADQINGQKK